MPSFTDATGVGLAGLERFKLTAFQPDFTTIQTGESFFVSAVGGGGLGGRHERRT